MIPRNQELWAVGGEKLAGYFVLIQLWVTRFLHKLGGGLWYHEPFLPLSWWWWLRFQKGAQPAGSSWGPSQPFSRSTLRAGFKPEKPGHWLPRLCQQYSSKFGLEYDEYTTWRASWGGTEKDSCGDLWFKVGICNIHVTLLNAQTSLTGQQRN